MKAIVAELMHLLSAMASACCAWRTAPMNVLPGVAGVVIGRSPFWIFRQVTSLSHTCAVETQSIECVQS